MHTHKYTLYANTYSHKSMFNVVKNTQMLKIYKDRYKHIHKQHEQHTHANSFTNSRHDTHTHLAYIIIQSKMKIK